MKWRLSAFLLIGIALFVVFQMTRSQASFSGETTWDFGNVRPSEQLEVRFAVTNRENALAVYGGFEQACGVRPAFSNNGVLQGNESGVLTLISRATRRRGPGGASFVLTETIRGMVRERTYRLTWNVVGGPWLDVSELWIDPTTDLPSVRVRNASSGVAISVVEAPRGLLAKVTKDTITLEFASQPMLLEGKESLVLAVTDRGKRYSFRIPVYACDRGGPRIYPSLSTVTSDGLRTDIPVGRVVGGVPEGWSVSCDKEMGRVHLKPDGQIVFLPDGAGVALKAGLIRVHLLNSIGKVQSTALINFSVTSS